MNIFWLNIDKLQNLNYAKKLNNEDKFMIYDFSYDCNNNEISYFTFCERLLKHGFSIMNESKKDMIIVNLDLEKLMTHSYEFLYFISMIYPLEPIIVGEDLDCHGMFNIKFEKIISFNPQTDFMVDLEKRINDKINTEKSNVSEIISMFNAYGTFLSIGKKYDKIIKIKDSGGLPISYDEFLNTIEIEKEKYSTIESSDSIDFTDYAIVRDHNPVDLFIRKMKKG